RSLFLLRNRSCCESQYDEHGDGSRDHSPCSQPLARSRRPLDGSAARSVRAVEPRHSLRRERPGLRVWQGAVWVHAVQGSANACNHRLVALSPYKDAPDSRLIRDHDFRTITHSCRPFKKGRFLSRTGDNNSSCSEQKVKGLWLGVSGTKDIL